MTTHLPVKAVAAQLNTSPDTVRRLIKAKVLPAFRIRGEHGPLRVTESDLDAYVDRQKALRSDPWKRTRTRKTA